MIPFDRIAGSPPVTAETAPYRVSFEPAALAPWVVAAAAIAFVTFGRTPPAPVAPAAPVAVPAPYAPPVPLLPPSRLTQLLAGQPDAAAEIAEFFAAAADVVRTSTIPSASALRAAYVRAGQTVFPAHAGRFPGLGQALDEELAKGLGLDDRTLDAPAREAAARTYLAIAEQLRQVR